MTSVSDQIVRIGIDLELDWSAIGSMKNAGSIGGLSAQVLRSDDAAQRIQREIDAGALLELQSDWTAGPLRFFARYDPTRAARFVEHAAEIAAQLRPQAG